MSKKLKDRKRKVKNFKRGAGSSLVPFFSARCKKEGVARKVDEVGKRVYYSGVARANREGNEHCTDRGLNRNEMEIVRKHRKRVKGRIEELREELELKHAEDWF